MIDYTTNVGRVRLNVADTNESALLLEDAQIQSWLEQNGDSTNWASYWALVTIATSEVLVSKKIRTQDLSTDGVAVADALLKLAGIYKSAALEEDGEADFVGFAAPVHNTSYLEGEEFRFGSAL